MLKWLLPVDWLNHGISLQHTQYDMQVNIRIRTSVFFLRLLVSSSPTSTSLWIHYGRPRSEGLVCRKTIRKS